MLPEQLIILQPMVDYIMEKQIELNFQQFKDYIKCILDVRIYLEFVTERHQIIGNNLVNLYPFHLE